MAIIQCENGHYYDDQKYENCPVCIRFEREGISVAQRNAREQEQLGAFALEYIRQKTGKQEDRKSHPEVAKNGTSRPDRSVENENERTVSLYSAPFDRERLFPVGWLVCREGRMRGHYFPLFAGFNRVGRGRENDVALTEAGEELMEVDHFSVVYEERQSLFFYVPKGGCAAIDGTVEDQTRLLQNGQSISVGAEELVLIAYCEGERRWNQG